MCKLYVNSAKMLVEISNTYILKLIVGAKMMSLIALSLKTLIMKQNLYKRT